MSVSSNRTNGRTYKGVHRICTACMGTGEVRVRPACPVSMPSTRIAPSAAPTYDTCEACDGTGNAPDVPRS